jgi:uncharacterized protein YbaR (Trm112 family)
MQKKLLEKLCCPFDKEALEVSIIAESDTEIHEGLLSCMHCKRYFPIVYGIPIMTPDEYRQRSLEVPVLERWGLQLDEDGQSFVLSNPEKVKEIKEV